ncbi:DM13 domain-containing protein [Streptomyces capparidis]
MGRAVNKPVRLVVVAASAVLATALGLGLYWFQPWALWIDEHVDEAVPVATAPATPPPASSGGAAPSGPAAEPSRSAAAATPETVASGELISHEHTTSGAVRVLRLADGSHVLRFEGLDTSNGPDLHVWLTDAPVIDGRDGWGVFDDGRHVSLGKLKGNKGDQNYRLPADVDPAAYRSVSIWCDRFDVSFGAAELT